MKITINIPDDCCETIKLFLEEHTVSELLKIIADVVEIETLQSAT